MLARSGPLPTGRGWAFEVKLDGFRCLVDTYEGFRARSRRGWNMTALLPELEALPEDLQLDGELVAFDERGHPDFHRLGRRMLHGDSRIRIHYLAFDLLGERGRSLVGRRYADRRARLEELALEGPSLRTVPAFADGRALYDEVVERGLEGVVAKRLRDVYRPGERGWVKRKNPAGPRFEEEREDRVCQRLQAEAADEGTEPNDCVSLVARLRDRENRAELKSHSRSASDLSRRRHKAETENRCAGNVKADADCKKIV
jgi:ATP-dependent DNA ligase